MENIDIYIDSDMEILKNIDIDKISNQLEFGISNRASHGPEGPYTSSTISKKGAILVSNFFMSCLGFISKPNTNISKIQGQERSLKI